MIVETEGDTPPENDFAAFEKAASSDGELPAPEENTEEADTDESTSGDEGDQEDTSEDDIDDIDDIDEETSEEDEDTKPKKTASDRIRELNRKMRELERAREADRLGFEARLAKYEEPDLTEEKSDGKKDDARTPPDPTDLKKYPLGSLDDRYIQDAIDFKAEEAAKKMVDSLLQRQEQSEAEAAQEAQLLELRSKADDVAAKGSELHEDYDEVVVAAGFRGDYALTQVTFEAAAEAEHGAQILYDLATNPKEAARIAGLSSFQQLKYVSEKNAEIANGRSGKKIPGATPPPDSTPRGRSKRTTISADTTNFAEFERLAKAAK